MKRRAFFFGVSWMAFHAACSRRTEPVDPVWTKTPCAHCAMLVGDRRHAAQAISGGERFYFDDIGCAVLWAEERTSAGVGIEAVWVRDAESSMWLVADTARYAQGAKTPMDFGVEARADGARSWAEIRADISVKAGRR